MVKFPIPLDPLQTNHNSITLCCRVVNTITSSSQPSTLPHRITTLQLPHQPTKRMSAQLRASRSAASPSAASSRRRGSPTPSQQLLSTINRVRSPSPSSSEFYTPDTSNISMPKIATRKSRGKAKGKGSEELALSSSRRKRASKHREADPASLVDGVAGKHEPKSPTPFVEDSQPPYVHTPSYRYTGYVPDSYGEDTDLELEERDSRIGKPYRRVQTTTTTKVVEEMLTRRPRSQVRPI